jgi:predicted PurR-regulated permease PerM
MNRALASGPIVWLGIIVTTCLLLVLFQTVLWLVMPVLLAVVAYYLMSPLVILAMARGITRARAVFIVTVLMSVVLVGVGASVEPKVSAATHDWQKKIQEYGAVGHKLIQNAEQTLYHYFPFLHHAQPAPMPTLGIRNNLDSDVLPGRRAR